MSAPPFPPFPPFALDPPAFPPSLSRLAAAPLAFLLPPSAASPRSFRSLRSLRSGATEGASSGGADRSAGGGSASARFGERLPAAVSVAPPPSESSRYGLSAVSAPAAP